MAEQKPDEREVVAKHYAGVDHQAGPAIYTRADVFDAIFDLGRFRDLPRDTKSLVVDLMSGVKCLVASEVKKRADKEGIPLDVHCYDIAFGKLPEAERKKLEAQGYVLGSGDITQGTGYETGRFHRATARFGVKNYQRDEQIGIFREVKRILVPEEYFVLVDMETPETSYELVQTERRRKSRHTVGEENAHHHIPTREMWFEMLKEAGLEPNKDDVYVTKSFVATTNWVTSKQMTEDGRKGMDTFLLDAPLRARQDFNIREEEGVDSKKVVKIDYPVVVIASKAI